MPTNIYQSRTTFDNSLMIPVLATELGIRAPRSLTMDSTFIVTNADGNKIMRPGYLISLMDSGLGRVFPASRIVSGASGATTIVVRDASIFKVGETLGVAADLTAAATAVGGTGITAIDLTTNTITIATALAAALTAGNILRSTVAVNGNAPAKIQGIILSAFNIADSSNDVGIYTSCTVYGQRLPFWATEIGTLFPEITLTPIAPTGSSFPVL